MSMIGKELAHFEIISQLGRGGMGEVYRARDRKLGREVAIKVLPEECVRDADRVARLQREARLQASLNHPNIAAVYGLEESAGTRFLVLELVEGETLADRLRAGPLPVEEALKLALEIAEALEAAHEKGVVHRDLKPANIKVAPDGRVKVLDFGLAKALAVEPARPDLSHSPTLSDAATMQGVILGTAAYMPPEQAKGKAVDRRADVWAFGAVLFEMLSGKRLHSGETVSETLASVIKGEPEWESLPRDLHPRIRLLLERCLEKDPRNRYCGIGDARVDIEEALADPGGPRARPAASPAGRAGMRPVLPWIAAVLLAGILAGSAAWRMRAPEPPRVIQFRHELPADQQWTTPIAPETAVSPDGGQLAYCANGSLYLRALGALQARLLEGTSGEAPFSPFFSPDGKWIAYFSTAGGQLKKIPVSGGAPVPLCDASPLFATGSWTDDGILFSTAGTPGIMRIAASGGEAETLFGKGDSLALIGPQMLPGGQSVLYADRIDSRKSSIMARSLGSGEAREIIEGDFARYLPTGHLAYTKAFRSDQPGGSLFVAPFDADRLETTGAPVLMAENVSGLLACRFAVSDSGVLALIPGSGNPAPGLTRTLTWVGRDKRVATLPAPPRLYLQPKISPDGTRVALTVKESESVNYDIWIWDIERETLMRLTTDEAIDVAPVWTPDGTRVVFCSYRDGDYGGIYCRAADGTGKVRRLFLAPDRTTIPFSWSGDGKILVTGETTDSLGASPRSPQAWDIGTVTMEGEHLRAALLDETYAEVQPQVSPDGRWIAYASGESGQDSPEVYVRPFPDVDGGKSQASTRGGTSVRWSPDGRELFYLSGGNELMAVAVQPGPALRLGPPRVLLESGFVSGFVADTKTEGIVWDVHPDGRKFLMMMDNPAAGTEELPMGSSRSIVVAVNWFEEVRERAPAD